MRKWNHACSLLVYVISVITPGRQRALTAFRRYYLLKNKLSDRMIKQLLNSVIAKYRDLSVSRRSIICLSLRLRQIIDLLATDKSRYFAQPRPIIANYCIPWSQEDSDILRLRLLCDWEPLFVDISVWFPGAASAFFPQLLPMDVSERSCSSSEEFVLGLLSFFIEGSAKTSLGYNNNFIQAINSKYDNSSPDICRFWVPGVRHCHQRSAQMWGICYCWINFTYSTSIIII